MTEKRDIAKRTGVVGSMTFLSRIFGLLRDMAIAATFGTHMAADAFFVAFRIPNLLRRLFAEGALTVSFVPIFVESFKKSPQEARRVANLSWSLMTVVLLGVTAIGILFAPLWVRLTAWGFVRDPEKFALTVSLTRVMFPYILLVSLAALAMGILNSLKHFAVPAVSPALMNLGVILGAVFLYQFFDPPVLGLALGVLLGGFLQLAIHFPYLKKFGFWPRLEWNPSDPAVRKIVGMMIPSAYGAAVYQFNVMAITLLASFLPTGSVSYLWYADRVMEFPLGVFAISLATVVLPTFSSHAAEKNIQALKETFRFGLRLTFFIVLPATAGLIVLSDEIVRVLFQRGLFQDVSRSATSSALIAFAIGLPFISGVRITSNAFYSLQDSKTPVRIANWSVVVNLALSLILMFPLKHVGLALAVSLASLFNFVMHVIDFRKKTGPLGLKSIRKEMSKAAIAALLMVVGLLFLKHFFPLPIGERLFSQALHLLFFIVAGILFYLGMGACLRMQEVWEVKRLFQKTFSNRSQK